MTIPFILLFLLVMTHASTLLPVSRNGYYRILGRKFDKMFSPPSMKPQKVSKVFPFNAPVKMSAYSKEYLPVKMRITDTVNPELISMKFSSRKNNMSSVKPSPFQSSLKFHNGALKSHKNIGGNWSSWLTPKFKKNKKIMKSLGQLPKFKINSKHDGKIFRNDKFIPKPSMVHGSFSKPVFSKHILFLDAKNQPFKNKKGFVPVHKDKTWPNKHKEKKDHPYTPEMLGLIAHKRDKPVKRDSAKFEVVPLTIKDNKVIAGQPVLNQNNFKIYDKPLPTATDVFRNFSTGQPGPGFSTNNLGFPNTGGPSGTLNSGLFPNNDVSGGNFDLLTGNNGIHPHIGIGGAISDLFPSGSNSGTAPGNTGGQFTGTDGHINQPGISLQATELDVLMLGQSPDAMGTVGFGGPDMTSSNLDGISQVHGVITDTNLPLNGAGTHGTLHDHNTGILALDGGNFDTGSLVEETLSGDSVGNTLTLSDASAISLEPRGKLIGNINSGILIGNGVEDSNRLGLGDRGGDGGDFVQAGLPGQFSVNVDVSISSSTDEQQRDESIGSHVGADGQKHAYSRYMSSIEPFGPGPYGKCRLPAKVVCGARHGWEHVTGMAEWCKSNCVVVMYSSYCDDARCRCRCI